MQLMYSKTRMGTKEILRVIIGVLISITMFCILIVLCGLLLEYTLGASNYEPYTSGVGIEGLLILLWLIIPLLGSIFLRRLFPYCIKFRGES
jgi:hypothetical protein